MSAGVCRRVCVGGCVSAGVLAGVCRRVCVGGCVHARVCMRVCACACVCVCMCMCMHRCIVCWCVDAWMLVGIGCVDTSVCMVYGIWYIVCYAVWYVCREGLDLLGVICCRSVFIGEL